MCCPVDFTRLIEGRDQRWHGSGERTHLATLPVLAREQVWAIMGAYFEENG